jgi:hypothetical protein
MHTPPLDLEAIERSEWVVCGLELPTLKLHAC